MKVVEGVGDCLRLAILKWVGEGPTRGCDCEDRIREMNQWGPDGCREHLDTIVDWLVKETKEHEWVVTETDGDGNETIIEVPPPLLARFARWTLKVPGGKIPIGIVCKRMVLSAIKKAETTADPSRDS